VYALRLALLEVNSTFALMSTNNLSNIPERDRLVTWHPFTHQKEAAYPLNIVKGDGVCLIDENGNKYIDAFSSWWVNLHGHANSYIAEKIYEQAKTLEQVAFSDFTHAPAVILAERLLSHLPKNQSKIFYSDNGSTAVEVALKMAIQYQHNIGLPKQKIIAFENGYHGDTFGSMSVAERNVFNNPFAPFLFNVELIPVPIKGKEDITIAKLEELLKGNDICAFIFEPLVQGAGGMVMYEPESLEKIMLLCKKYNCITIADEVMTGFGRTGKFWATNYIETKPDIICLSKGITGGFMPLGVTSCAGFIYDAFLSDDKTKTFYHGHSYTANPLACAAANASLDLLEKQEMHDKVQEISAFFERMKRKYENHTAVIDCRNRGCILALELKTSEGTSYLNQLGKKVSAFFLQRGIIVRPLGNVLYFIPPYCITIEQLEYIEKCTDELLILVDKL
jgi:adenosylmethionine---8-amino-7-oxononanoate aminotransferase